MTLSEGASTAPAAQAAPGENPMLNDPTLYLTAAMLYAAQARDALAHRHPCAGYIGLALVHLAMGFKKALAG